MDALTRALKLFVVVGGLLLIAGFALLGVLLLDRKDKREARELELSERATPIALDLPAGLRVQSVLPDGARLLLTLRGDAQDFIAIIDAETGERVRLYALPPQE